MLNFKKCLRGIILVLIMLFSHIVLANPGDDYFDENYCDSGMEERSFGADYEKCPMVPYSLVDPSDEGANSWMNHYTYYQLLNGVIDKFIDEEPGDTFITKFKKLWEKTYENNHLGERCTFSCHNVRTRMYRDFRMTVPINGINENLYSYVAKKRRNEAIEGENLLKAIDRMRNREVYMSDPKFAGLYYSLVSRLKQPKVKVLQESTHVLYDARKKLLDYLFELQKKKAYETIEEYKKITSSLPEDKKRNINTYIEIFKSNIEDGDRTEYDRIPSAEKRFKDSMEEEIEQLREKSKEELRKATEILEKEIKANDTRTTATGAEKDLENLTPEEKSEAKSILSKAKELLNASLPKVTDLIEYTGIVKGQTETIKYLVAERRRERKEEIKSLIAEINKYPNRTQEDERNINAGNNLINSQEYPIYLYNATIKKLKDSLDRLKNSKAEAIKKLEEKIKEAAKEVDNIAPSDQEELNKLLAEKNDIKNNENSTVTDINNAITDLDNKVQKLKDRKPLIEKIEEAKELLPKLSEDNAETLQKAIKTAEAELKAGDNLEQAKEKLQEAINNAKETEKANLTAKIAEIEEFLSKNNKDNKNILDKTQEKLEGYKEKGNLEDISEIAKTLKEATSALDDAKSEANQRKEEAKQKLKGNLDTAKGLNINVDDEEAIYNKPEATVSELEDANKKVEAKISEAQDSSTVEKELQKLIDNINANKDKLDSSVLEDLNTKLEEAKAKIEASDKTKESLVEAKNNLSDAYETAKDSNLNLLKVELEKLKELLKNNPKESKNIEPNLQTSAEEYIKNFVVPEKDNLEDIKSKNKEIKDKITEINNSISSRKEKAKNDLASKIQELNNLVDSNRNSTTENLSLKSENTIKDLITEATKVKDSSDLTVASAEAEIENLNNKIKEYTSEINNNKAIAKANLLEEIKKAEKVSGLEEAVSSAKTVYNNDNTVKKYKEALNTLEEKIKEAKKKELNDKITQYKGELTYLTEGEAKQELQDAISSAETVYQDEESSVEKYSEEIAKLDTKHSKAKTSIENELRAKIEDLKAKIAENDKTTTKNLKVDEQNEKEKNLEEYVKFSQVDHSIKEYRDKITEIDGKITDITNKVNANINNAKQKLEEKIVDALNKKGISEEKANEYRKYKEANHTVKEYEEKAIEVEREAVNALKLKLNDLITKATELKDNENTPQDVKDILQTAINEANAKKESSSLEELYNAVEAISSKIDNAKSQLLNKLNEKIGALEDILNNNSYNLTHNLKTEEEQNATELKKTSKNKANNESSFEVLLEELKKIEQSITDSTNAIERNKNEAKEQLRTAISNASSVLNEEELKEFKTVLEKENSAVTVKELEKAKSDLEIKKANKELAESSLESLIEIAKKAQEKLNDDELNKKIEEAERISSNNTSSAEEKQRIKTELEQELQNAKQKKLDELKASILALEQKLNDNRDNDNIDNLTLVESNNKITDAKGITINNTIDEITKHLEDIKAQLQKVEDNISERKQKAKEELQAEITKGESKGLTEEQLKPHKDLLSSDHTVKEYKESLNSLKEKIANKEKEQAKQKLLEKINELNTSLTTNASETTNNLTATEEEAHKKVKENAEIVSNKDNVTLEELQEEITKVSKEIEKISSEVTKNKEEAKKQLDKVIKQAELENQDTEEAKKVKENSDSTVKDINDAKTKLEEALTNSKDAKFNELQNKINELDEILMNNPEYTKNISKELRDEAVKLLEGSKQITKDNTLAEMDKEIEKLNAMIEKINSNMEENKNRAKEELENEISKPESASVDTSEFEKIKDDKTSTVDELEKAKDSLTDLSNRLAVEEAENNSLNEAVNLIRETNDLTDKNQIIQKLEEAKQKLDTIRQESDKIDTVNVAKKMIELVKNGNNFEEVKTLLDKIRDKDASNYTKLKEVFDKNIKDKVYLKLKELITELRNKIDNDNFSDVKYLSIKNEIESLKNQMVDVQKIEETEAIIDLLNNTYNEGTNNRDNNLALVEKKINANNQNTVYLLDEIKEIYNLLKQKDIKNLNLEKYDYIIRELDKIDVGIVDRSSDKYYFDVQLGGDYNIRNAENKLDITNLLLGLRAGTNHEVFKNVKLGAFIEYSNDYLDTFALGLSNAYTNDAHILKNILRYRFVTNYDKVKNINVDLYSKYGYKYTKDKFSVTANVGLLATYTFKTLVDEKIALEGAFKLRLDLGSRIAYHWFYFEPIFSLKANTKQRLVQIDMPNNERDIKQTAFNIVDFRVKFGVNPNITKDIKMIIDFETGMKKYTKLSVGFTFEK